jgi:hypothetical protein
VESKSEEKTSDASASTKDAAANKTGTEAEAEATPKRSVQRRSVWICVPVEYEEVAVVDSESGEMRAEKQPTRYAITECPGGDGQKKAMLAALAKHEIDPLNYGDVLMFRANPLDFKISNQLIIRI